MTTFGSDNEADRTDYGGWILIALIPALVATTVIGATKYGNEWTVGAAYLMHRDAVIYVDASKVREDAVLDVAAGDTLPLLDARDVIKLTNGRFVIECRNYCADRRVKITRGIAIVVRGDSTFRYGAGSTIPASRKTARGH
jgi:hypothetical protein